MRMPKLPKLPRLDDPSRYVDLFVVDFADGQVGVGYTADEVAALAEREDYRARMKVYRIHDAQADGRVELVGVPIERFSLEAGMFFGTEQLSSARADHEELCSLLRRSPPPTRCRLVLGECRGWRTPFQVGLVYPAECDPAMARYLNEHRYHGGVNVVGGTGIVIEFNEQAIVLESEGFAPQADRAGRDWETLRTAVGQTLQR